MPKVTVHVLIVEICDHELVGSELLEEKMCVWAKLGNDEAR
jgi:hypothetical protein